jgi:hypothetical protein
MIRCVLVSTCFQIEAVNAAIRVSRLQPLDGQASFDALSSLRNVHRVTKSAPLHAQASFISVRLVNISGHLSHHIQKVKGFVPFGSFDHKGLGFDMLKQQICHIVSCETPPYLLHIRSLVAASMIGELPFLHAGYHFCSSLRGSACSTRGRRGNKGVIYLVSKFC